MGLADDALKVAGQALASDIDTMKLHSGDPGNDGTKNTTTAGSESVTPSTDSAGVVTIGSTGFAGGSASGDCKYVSLWKTTTFYGSYSLTGDQTFNAAGKYTVDSVTITPSNS